MRIPGTRGSSNAAGGGLAGIWRGMGRWQRVCLLSNVPLFALYCLSRPAPAPAPAPPPALVLPLPPSSNESVYVVERTRPDLSVPVFDPFQPLDSDSRGRDWHRFREPLPMPDNPEVALPDALRRVTFGDTVELRARISEEGNVEDVSVLRSCGDGRVDREAAATLRQWRYYPALWGGQPVHATEYLEMAVGEAFRE